MKSSYSRRRRQALGSVDVLEGCRVKIFHHLEVGPLACNCYVVGDPLTREAIVIDPGGDADLLLDRISKDGLTVTAIVATHAHFDHVIAAEQLRAHTGAPFYLHPSDKPILEWLQESGRLFLGIELPPPPEVDTEANEGDVLRAGDVSLRILHTPGHSPGSISLQAPDVLFSGDTLFAGSIGRTDLPGGDHQALLTAVREKLFPLADDMTVYPGHGPSTTLATEREMNPFVGEAARRGLS
jgi:glyoxylase-like metal-dependent hydrolase (beta-lactamase superfamily II)